MLFPAQQDLDSSWAQQDLELLPLRAQMQVLGSQLLTSSEPSSSLAIPWLAGVYSTDHPFPAECVPPVGSVG